MKVLRNFLDSVWESDHINDSWNKINDVHSLLELPEHTGGVNPGDQRAIYYLIRSLDIRNVLEIGTHIGCSTVNIALALKDNDGAKLTTVDIDDVNTTEGCPRDLIHKIGCESFVDFVVSDSVEFLNNTNEKYDFIFLDGDHSYGTVYQELPIAYEKLKDNGIILFHDYFEDYKPLWKSSANVLEGPFRAVSQLLKDGLKLHVEPCGELPATWKTKFPGERNTSLAIGMKDDGISLLHECMITKQDIGAVFPKSMYEPVCEDGEKIVSNIVIPYKTNTTTQSYEYFIWDK
jgi:predicted O-methyltransferase YrrM